MKLTRTEEFIEWYEGQPAKIKAQILARLQRIEQEGHFGSINKVGLYVSELKFNNGNRIYYTIIKVADEIMVLILGGNKNGQQKDINKANQIVQEIQSKFPKE